MNCTGNCNQGRNCVCLPITMDEQRPSMFANKWFWAALFASELVWVALVAAGCHWIVP